VYLDEGRERKGRGTKCAREREGETERWIK